MDCLLLLGWTVPVAVLSGCSMQFPTLPWLGSAVKAGREHFLLQSPRVLAYQTLQLCCLCCMFHAATLTSDSISISELNHDYVFVTPVKVDSSGSYISHNVLHSSRKKRSTQSSKSSLHYKFSAFGQELHLELKPSTILSNSFIVQVLGKDGVSNSQEHDIEQCFYQGFIRNDSTSSVAISTCVGLSGLIRTQKIEFLISPLPQRLAQEHNYTSPAGHHPHVLYKRTAEEKVHRYTVESNPKYFSLGHHRTHTSHKYHAQANGYQHGRFQKQHFCGRRKKYAPKPPTEETYIRSDEYGTSARFKRSSAKIQKNGSLNVETLVVADKKMLEKHGKENVTTYILTVMNMVSSLFKDGTIGSDINIIVVSLLLLEQEPGGLLINHHADQSLNSFCQWQSALVGKNGKRHDHAILLTGFDICSWKNEPCDTLGFAPISGMCSKYRSCTINEDTGLGLAFTIAHESGHNFGMIHDGEGNPCRKAEGNIMSPTLTGNNGVFSWSVCSRQYLNKFLSTAQAACLIDEPKQTGQYKYPDKLPGQIYDADTQCKWQFGMKAKVCNLSFVKDICKSLWCHKVGHRCETKFMPAAEGTACGISMWCRRGQCVKYGDHGPKPVNGEWSAWSEWSQCTRTCGGGVTYQERHCNNPKPQYGGKFCQGSSRIYQLCNTQPCPANSLDFRAQQCAEYNSKPFRGWFYKWKPYTKVEEEDRCKLYCTAEDFDFFFAMSSKVKDGTLCSPNKYDVCIDGICEQVGCDHGLGSKAVLDACGVCKGDNSTCKFFKGQYLIQHKANDYYAVVTIPAGARSIHLHEMQISTSYLAVRNLSKKYYLTGDWTIDWPGKFPFAGTVFDYQRSFNHPESLYAAGPTNETLVFEILLQGKNPGIAWEYTFSKINTENKTSVKKHSHSWVTVQSECSATCGGGHITTKAICLEDHRTRVNSSFCGARTKPLTETKLCNTNPCPAYWSPGEWGACSKSCGGGQQSRLIQCVQKKAFQREEVVAHALCPVSTPAQVQTCNSQDCPPEWSPGLWSQCSKTCGRGVKKRDVYCKSTGSPKLKILPDSMCSQDHKPESQQTCVLGRCPKNDRLQWVISSWSECSASCGPGVHKRELKCGEKSIHGKLITFPQRRCRNIKKPNIDLEETCNNGACPSQTLYNMVSGWYSSPWQQCTVTCGGGVQTRSVQCLRQGRPASGCLPHQKPAILRACNTNFCPAPVKRDDPSCVDFFSWCHLVPQHGVCNHKFYGKQCCKSCTKKN
ncbi:A disintegrin and metalloproteinase with thrombospondin motifs 18 isoform X2 [Oxyura jamaicensis]|uniref:A disintegrin and metalloproteinase with thrombospondin motifs 18 isoform X2 n=1 Tax=Oxyura jamaicensis TaxID=8884 RepID=UPI0015A5C7C7|nr:A disintegrin and metalloproteinase with thrombospondin motifs 18 isoform X2 [Oxyura jamaicensis]